MRFLISYLTLLNFTPFGRPDFVISFLIRLKSFLPALILIVAFFARLLKAPFSTVVMPVALIKTFFGFVLLFFNRPFLRVVTV